VSATVTVELERAARYLAERGIESARLEAEVLLADVLGWDRARLFAERGHEIDDGERLRLDELLLRRGRREPLQHVRGRQEFFSREFVVDSRVLIPRPETEVLVETALAIARAIERPAILDVGTGSGAIAITLALGLPDAVICATDSSPEAIEVARSNARRLGADARVEFRRGDLCAPFAERRFDLVVSNPPYVPSREIAALAPEVRDHEPRVALDGGADGLEHYRRLATSASEVMTTGGALLVEIGFGQREPAAGAFAAGGFVVANVTRDLSGIERVLTVRRG
jgi:release factor glutamine methyltransferase